MGISQRRKGERGERWLRDACRRHGWDTIRGKQYRGGKDSPDVKADSEIDQPHFPRVQLEMKFGYDPGLNVLKCYDKLKGETPLTYLPVLVWKKTRKRALAILDMDDLFDIINESNRWWNGS